MTAKRPGYIDVDALMPEVTLEQVAAYYNVALPELTRIGDEIRTRCFLQCGQSEETGERALAIKAEHPAKPWHCHQYGCGRGGNVVSLCDFLKSGTHMDGKPRGDRFKAIARDLKAMVEGTLAGETEEPTVATKPAKAAPEKPAAVNVPLHSSEKEAARQLVTLDEKFLVEAAGMSPKAASYFRRRPFLTSEVCRQWRVGYLPRDSGGDRRGGTMRGRVVYSLRDEAGEVLTWFGRDPDFEEKHREWIAGGRRDREPVKTTFVKGFSRGLELYGQDRLLGAEAAERLGDTGLIVVEGPNDVIRLSTLGDVAVGLCSNTVTADQVEKIERLAREVAGGRVALMLDADVEGDRGTREALWLLSQRQLAVRLVWTRSMYGGQFADRQPESLTEVEWNELLRRLTS